MMETPDYSYGIDYDYSVWPSSSVLTLCSVPWDNNYRDVVKFSDKDGLNKYIDSMSTSTSLTRKDASYIPPSRPSVKLDIPHNKAIRYNYLRVSNPVLPIDGDIKKDYYYFVLGVNYISANTTEFVIQLDIWATYNFDVQFGRCFIERGHIGIAAYEMTDPLFGRDGLTVPEGVDIGNEYMTVNSRSLGFGTLREDGSMYDDGISVVLVSTTQLDSDAGTVESPQLTTANGSVVNNIPSGASYYAFKTVADFRNWIESMSEKPWVLQGIISMTVTPNLETNGFTLTPSNTPNMYLVNSTNTPLTKHVLFEDFRNLSWLRLEHRHLKKFATYPYMAIELTGYNGQSLMLKPEMIPHYDLDVISVMLIGSSAPKLVLFPINYGANHYVYDKTPNGNIVRTAGEFLNCSITISNFPQLLTVNNNSIGWLAANRHSLNYQYSSADWSYQKTLAGADLAYNQATNAMGVASESTSIGIQANEQLTNLSNTMGVGRAAVGGIGQLASRNVVGAATTAVSAAFDVHQANAQLAINSNTARAQLNNTLRGSAFMRDTNQAYAHMAASGDYQNAIAGINAKVQDAQLIQPSVVGSSGGDALNLAIWEMGVTANLKVVAPSAQRIIADYWLRYGYAIQRFSSIPKSLQAMDTFTYWKLKETYISSSTCPESFKQAIRGIFESGVTVWNDPKKIGNVVPSTNKPLTGISIL